MSEKVKSIFLDNTTVFGDNIVDHDLTKSWKTVFGDDNPNINNDSLVAYWRFFDDKFFDSFNKTRDSSDNDHHIIYPAATNIPDLSHETPFNNNNTTVSFNGSVSMGQVSDHDDLSFVDGTTNKPFSISFWFKFKDLPVYDATATYNFATILTKRGVATTTREYSVFFQKVISTDVNSLHFRIYDDDIDRYVQAKIILSENYVLGEWYQATATFDGSQESDFSTGQQGLDLRINGENKNTTYTSSVPVGVTLDNETYALYIGVKPGPEQYLHTFLSELAIWNRKLTATEAKALHDVKYGVLLKSSMVTYSSYTPRLMLRDSDNRRGQYPTVRRTGDKDRSGSFNIQFNDENTVEFKKIPTVYPGEKDQSFSITDGSASYTYSSQDNLVAHWRPQDAVIPTASGIPITTPWGATRFIGGSHPVGGQAYIANRVPGGQIAYVEHFAEIYDTDDPRYTDFTERDGKIYEARGTRNSYKYLFQDDSDDGLNIGTAATWDAIIGNNTPDGSTQKMTFSAWIYKTGDGGTNIGTILDFGEQDISLWSTATEELSFSAKWGTWPTIAFEWTSSPGVFSLNTWTHITITYDATHALNNPALYINGTLTSMPISSGVPSSPYYGIAAQDGFIGNASNLDRGWEGNIADVAIWNNTLSADEVKALYLNDTRWNPDITTAQEVQYPIGLLKDDSRLPELTPDITSKGLVTRSHGGESFSIITDAEDISAYNDELDKTQDTDFYNVGTDRDVYPGFSSPLRSKTSFTFDITATEEQYVFRQTGDANPTGEFPGEDYTGFCYYAFGKNKWEQIGLINPEDGSDRVYAYGIDAGDASGIFPFTTTEFPNLSECGPQNFPMQFTGRAGFSILSNENTPLTLLSANKTVLGYDKIGSPTSTSFAPFGAQYHATSSQTMKVDEFITDPFFLEKITIKLPVEARHLVLSDADKTRDLSNYVAFLYLQRNSKSERVSTSERSIIAASSFCFYNNKVLTDNADTATFPTGEYIPFFPIHDFDFSHEFDIDAMVNFDDEITLEFTPEIFNPVKLSSNIPNIRDLKPAVEFDPGDYPDALGAAWSGDKLILEDTFGTTTEFTFDGSVGDGTDITLTPASFDTTMTEAALIINATDSFIATYESTTSTLTIKQAAYGLAGETDVTLYNASGPSTSIIGTFATSYNTRSTAYNMFWPGGSSTLPFTVDGISTYSGKDSDVDLSFATNYNVADLKSMIFGNVYKEYYANPLTNGLTSVLEQVRINKPITRHIKNYGTKITDPEIEVDAWRTMVHDYFSVKDRSQKTAFVLLPGDELILGIEKTTCGDRLGPGTTSNSYQFGLDSQQSFSGSYIKIKTEPASMTMYGSLIKENKEHHNTINQDLTSNSVHEIFYGDPVLDQFEIEPISMYANSTRDEYVSGAMSTLDSDGIPIGEREVVYRVSAGDVTDLWSLTRFNTFADSSERYYDTVLPSTEDILNSSGLINLSDSSIDWSGTYEDPDDPTSTLNYSDLDTNLNGIKDGQLDISLDDLAGTGFGPTYTTQDIGAGTHSVSVDTLNLFVDGRLATSSTTDHLHDDDPDRSTFLSKYGMKSTYQYCLDFFETDPLTHFPFSLDIKRQDSENVSILSRYATNFGITTDSDWWRDASGLAAAGGGPAPSPPMNVQKSFYHDPGPMSISSTDIIGFGPTYETISNKDIKNVIFRNSTETLSSEDETKGYFNPIPFPGASVTNKYNYGFDSEIASSGDLSSYAYGVRNIDPVSSTAVFRSNNYGQFRDMLEQRQFCRFYKQREFFVQFGAPPGFPGAENMPTVEQPSAQQQTNYITKGPVEITFVEKNSSTPVSYPQFTNSSNLSMHATSSLPFFDDLETYPSGSNREYISVSLNTAILSPDITFGVNLP